MNSIQKPQLLVSVVNIEEASSALENGADIIDLKNPSAGALGALPIATVQSVVNFVKTSTANATKLTSATIGDLPMEPALILAKVTDLMATHVDIIKIGFFETNHTDRCLRELQGVIHKGAKLVAVLFAEYQYSPDLISAIKQSGFVGVMLDTAQKNGLNLLDYYNVQQLHLFAERVYEENLQFGLAGSLKVQHIDVLKTIKPSYLGFRGAVCCGSQRTSPLDAEKVREIRNLM